MKNVTLIIPAYNEEETLSEILTKVCELEFVQQILLVDDSSTDRTPKIAQQLASKYTHLDYVRHEQNKGKTAAIKSALKKIKGEIVVIQDADLEYDPEELRYVCEPIWDNNADVVYGSRFLTRRASRVLYFYHYLANKALTFLSNMFTNKNMTDIETCYKAFRTPFLANMPITSSGFGFEVEVTANISKTRARVYEVPISYYGRTYEEGKKISTGDGLMALWYIFYFNLFTSSETKKYIKNMEPFCK